MGYYTRYELYVEPSSMYDEIEVDIVEISGYNSPFDGEYKWYNHEDDCKTVSKLHPTALIQLHGEGEESGDIWYKYFKNGKMQVCKAELVFPVYDESKLK